MLPPLVFERMLAMLLAVALLSSAVSSAEPPHVLFVLADDLGWASVGFNRAQATPEVVTPNIDALVAEGVKLNRHYVYMVCTPSRSSVQSGV